MRTMSDIYRTGSTLGTTLFRGPRTDGQQPVGIVFNLPPEEARTLAARIVCLLNKERPHARGNGMGARYEALLAVQAQALEVQARTITELQQERAALCRALHRESSDNQLLRADDVALVEQAEALQEENVRLTEQYANLRAKLAFPVSEVINENISLKRAMTEKELAFAQSAGSSTGEFG